MEYLLFIITQNMKSPLVIHLIGYVGKYICDCVCFLRLFSLVRIREMNRFFDEYRELVLVKESTLLTLSERSFVRVYVKQKAP